MFASSQGGGQELVISLLRPGLLPGAFFVGQSKNKPTKRNPDTGGAMAGLHTSKMNGGCRYGKKLADDPSQQQGKAPGQIVPCLLKVRPESNRAVTDWGDAPPQRLGWLSCGDIAN